MPAYLSTQFRQVAPNLYRDGNDKYHARITLNGKAHKKSLGTTDIATARRELREYEKELQKGIIEKPDIGFDEAGKLWLASLYELKPKSKTRRETSLRAITPVFKGCKLRTVTKQQLTVWAQDRTKEVSARTFNIDRETLVLVFDYAKDTLGVIKDNPAERLAKKKVKKAQITPPTKEQFAGIVAYLDVSKKKRKGDLSRHVGMFVRFLAYTGMRLEEARCVRWKDVDFIKGTLRVTGGELGNKNHSERTIPLFDPVRKLLEKFPVDQRKANDLIFNLTTAREVLISASETIGLQEGEHFTHHDMRHFFCTNAIEQNIPDHVIAAWLGHTDGGVLVKTTYGHLRKSYSDAEALKMTFES